MSHAFTAELWIWEAKKSDAWIFVTVPQDFSDELRARTTPGSGFGSVRVQVTVGDTTWRTSAFPDSDSGCFVVPIKAAVRNAEVIAAGDRVEIQLSAIDAAR